MKKFWKEWQPTFWFLILLLFMRGSYADWYTVPTGSMQPTIAIGDRILVDKTAYQLRLPYSDVILTEFSEPQVGDIIVFNDDESGDRLIKRVIAKAGDKIAMQNNRIYVNGNKIAVKISRKTDDVIELNENLSGKNHLIQWLPNRPALRTFSTYTVPDDELFVMGDNRDNSKDSRYIGPVKISKVLGRAHHTLWSWDSENWHFRQKRFYKPLE